MCPPSDGGAGFCQTIMFCLDHSSRSSFLVLSSRVVLVFGCLSRTFLFPKTLVTFGHTFLDFYLPSLLTLNGLYQGFTLFSASRVCLEFGGGGGGGELFYSLFVLCALIDL